MKRRTFLGSLIGGIAIGLSSPMNSTASKNLTGKLSYPVNTTSFEGQLEFDPSGVVNGELTIIDPSTVSDSASIAFVHRTFPLGNVKNVEYTPLNTITPTVTLTNSELTPSSEPEYVELYYCPDGRSGPHNYVCESDPLNLSGEQIDKYQPFDLSVPDEDGYHPLTQRTDTNGKYTLNYIWRALGRTWNFEYEISKAVYSNTKLSNPKWIPWLYTDSLESPLLKDFLTEMLDTAWTRGTWEIGARKTLSDFRSVDDAKRLMLVYDFVTHIRYMYDSETTDKIEYYRYPAETLVDVCGDCEDTTVLLAGLLEQAPFNYDTALILPREHTMVGVPEDQLPVDDLRLEPTRIVTEDRTYIPFETTRLSWPGEYPEDRPLNAVYVDGAWKEVNVKTIVGDTTKFIKNSLTHKLTGSKPYATEARENETS